jgi:hypothetical protein
MGLRDLFFLPQVAEKLNHEGANDCARIAQGRDYRAQFDLYLSCKSSGCSLPGLAKMDEATRTA